MNPDAELRPAGTTKSSSAQKIAHTPAPWTVLDSSIITVGVPDKGAIAIVGEEARQGGLELSHDIGLANARLIAAAPALLEACKLALLTGSENMTVAEERRAKCRAAISLAEKPQSSGLLESEETDKKKLTALAKEYHDALSAWMIWQNAPLNSKNVVEAELAFRAAMTARRKFDLAMDEYLKSRFP